MGVYRQVCGRGWARTYSAVAALQHDQSDADRRRAQDHVSYNRDRHFLKVLLGRATAEFFIMIASFLAPNFRSNIMHGVIKTLYLKGYIGIVYLK